jgi:hypothetical protein
MGIFFYKVQSQAISSQYRLACKIRDLSTGFPVFFNFLFGIWRLLFVLCFSK